MINLGKEEPVAVSDGNGSRSLRQRRLIAFRETLKWINMRLQAHAGHVDEIKVALFLYGEH